MQKRTMIYLILTVSFFLPWISYGFISLSGFAIPEYVAHSNATLSFFSQGKSTLPAGYHVIYLLYLYPLFLLFGWKKKSSFLDALFGLVPIGAVVFAFFSSEENFVSYLGWGMYFLIGGSLALILQSFSKKRS